MTSEIKLQRQELSYIANKQQQLAADPQKSVWVGASAGTGKTKVLSDRVLRLLLNGVDSAKILCLTYTKAAAVEMNSRVAKRLSQWAIAQEEELEKELSELFGHLPKDIKTLNKLKSTARRLFAVLLDTPGGIKIQTIHSFCQEVLKRFPLEAKVSPYFEVMDDRNTKEAIEEIKEKLIAAINKDENSPIAQAMIFLTENFSEFKFPEVIAAIINQRGKINRIINNPDLIDTIANRLNIDVNDDKQQIIDDFFAQLPRAELQILLNAWLNYGGKTDNEKALRLAPILSEKPDFAKYCLLFMNNKDEIYKTIASKAVISQEPRVIDIYNHELERVILTKQKLKALAIFRSTKAVAILAQELIKGYEHYKQIHAKMDYNDMILLTRNLLENRDAARWVLFKLDGGIENILIDEAQDTSPDQWAIVQAISDEFFAEENSKKTIFAVGDRKQSIYSFQGADPDKFDQMREYFAGKASNFSKINLEVSFRSTTAVLDVVNQVFLDDAIKKGVASEGENIIHNPFRQGEGGKVEFWELVEPEEGENKQEWLPPVEHKSNPSTSSRMAKQIASKIKQAVASKEILLSQNRPLRYSDFLILVRSRDAFCQELIRECKTAGVTVSGIDRIQLLEQIAIQDLVSLGKFLLLPEDDLSLAEVLKSPLFGLDDNDLFQLCYQRKYNLWQRLGQLHQYQDIYQQLQKLLNLADYVRPFELYSYVLTQMQGRKKFFRRMGEEADDGLDEFLNLSLNFEQTHIPSLQKFIDWIVKDDVEIKRELEQGQSDMVRLMTVHGSKGLQAPIVILPDTTRIPQCKKSAEFLWDDELFFYPASAGEYDDNCNRLKEKQKQKMMEEYRRLLYVALTRAEDRMIFCGYRKSRKPSDDSWYNLFKQSICKIADFNQEQNTWHYQSLQLIEPKKQKAQTTNLTEFEHEDWIYSAAESESPLAKPLTPSRPEEDEPPAISPLNGIKNQKLYRRGKIIHRLLQFLPEIDNLDNRLIADFIYSQAPDMPQIEVNNIIREVNLLINNPQFGAVFGANSKAEVPLMGMIDGKIISGQIDRLIVEEKRVMIVDFKTNRPAAASPQDIPQIYRKQMAAYKKLLQQIYPNKEVITLILWTNTTKLMEV